MILGYPVYPIGGNDIGKALVVQGYRIDNRFGKDNGSASWYRLAVDEPGA
jgi:hypothetical protein